MSKKSKRKSNLRLSILLLILLLILLISSTYAWFTANKTVTISSLDVHIEAQNGLQISTNGTTWKSMIDNTDITTNAYTGNTNQLPGSMEPVSTVGEIDEATGNMLMYYGTVASDKTDGKDKLTATPETDKAGTEGKYIAFDMFLRVNADTRLQMNTTSNVKVKEGSTDQGIKNAARVAFCDEGTVPVGSTVDEMIAKKEAVSFLSPGKTVYIWEPNANWHTDPAVAHAFDAYGLTIKSDGTSAPVPYYGIKNEITTPTLLGDTNNGNSADFAAIDPDWKTEPVEDDGLMPAPTEVFSLGAGITKIRVYMWVEGQDVDCENAASGTDISYNIQLQVIEPEKP